MARFEDLESRFRPSRDDPRFGAQRLGPYRQPQDPSRDTFDERFAPANQDPIGDYIREQNKNRSYPVMPGTRERHLDPTKVITDVPPSLNAPPQREAGPYEDKTKQAPYVPYAPVLAPTMRGPPPPGKGGPNVPPGRPGERIGALPSADGDWEDV